jgi:predicted metalloprotease with PDZ domain
MYFMKKIFRLTGFLIISISGIKSYSQDKYEYSVNLNKVENDALTVELKTPAIKQNSAVFSLPKIIPGTYAIADYGKFISDVKAFDKNGKLLSISKINDNQWKITNATSLSRITYKVDDVFDTEIKHNIYPMAATNFEEGKNFSLNAPGVFGFMEGLRHLPFQVSIQKPSQLYASTPLKPINSTATNDVFEVNGVDNLYEMPIMYTVPDTASVQVGNCQVLVSVYSPNKQIAAKQITEWLGNLLDAARQYLGGKLPTDKYAFLFYFKDPKVKHNFPVGLGGALEHPTSSYYYLYEGPAVQLRNTIVDICSHEFFHIITPLTIASKEVKEFNFNEAVMSKHLWLYEGVTEYTAHHVQVKYGLNTAQQFLDKLGQKITTSRTKYKDSLPFTELSKESAGKWANEYGNVYQKGALIAACLDIYLSHLSNGTYNLRNLTYDLGVRFGKYRYFNDDELFDNIAELTYPEIKDFLVKYVAGPTPIPYEYYFGLAGVQLIPRREQQVFSLGGIYIGPNAKGQIAINPPFNPNEFGKKIGYRAGDELYAVNGKVLTTQNYNEIIDEVKAGMKEGETISFKIGRLNANNAIDTMTLSTPITKVTLLDINKLVLMPDPTPKQLLVQKAWLTPTNNSSLKVPPVANAADVNSIDAIIKATYSVISGPAGPRDWNRFYSLFLPEAEMGAVVKTPDGKKTFHTMTPEGYQKTNAPFFAQSGFYEEEIKRNVQQYGNVASVQSSYQFRMKPEGKAEQRGVNYFTLVQSNGRWWIANLSWQDEEKDLPLPKELDKKTM